MYHPSFKIRTLLALVLAAMLGAAPTLAKEPVTAGPARHERSERGPDKRDHREVRPQNNTREREYRRDTDRAAPATRGARDDSRDRDPPAIRDDRRNEMRAYRNDRHDDVRAHAYFDDRHREVVRRYYADRYRANDCPPGLARKHNGCMPPGQLKAWRIGHPLPRDLISYDAPAGIVIQLGAPPDLHRYVRVGADILLIAIGTGLVVDALEDLSAF
jgi:Ni/Co efflux regulator RcnB